MSQIKELLAELQQNTQRMNAIEKKVSDLGAGHEAAAKILQSAAGHTCSGHNVVMGYDGAETMSLINISNPRQKALGMGEFLQTVANACSNNDRHTMENKLEKKWGSRHVQKTTMSETSGNIGGYTLPIQFYANLLRAIGEESFCRPLCNIIPMQSRQIDIPALDQSKVPPTGTSAFNGNVLAQWQPENSTINQTEPTFRQISLVARDLVFTSVASNQLLQDNAIVLDTLLTTIFTQAMSWCSDYYILRGTGANQPIGVLNGPATLNESRSSAGHVTQDDLAQMLSKLLINSWRSARWMIHPSVIPELVNMTNGATNSGFLTYLNMSPSTEGGPLTNKLPMQIFGIPVIITEKLPALGTRGDVLLVDLSKHIVGDRLALQIEASNQVYFRQNQMLWRVVARWDSQPEFNAPITQADGTYQMSNAVALN